MPCGALNMAVEEVVSKNLGFSLGIANEMPETTLEHVRRIRKDHDYTKYTSPEEGKDCGPVVLRGKDAKDPKSSHNELEVLDGVLDSMTTKWINKKEELPNEGIEASDVSSLLEQFLEYEQTSNQSISPLTPATSPGHCYTWNEPFSLKLDSHVEASDLTPPSTPPVVEPAELDTSQDVENSSSEKCCKENKLGKDTLVNGEEEDGKSRRKRKLHRDNDDENNREQYCDAKKTKLHSEFESLGKGLGKAIIIEKTQEEKSTVVGENSVELCKSGREEKMDQCNRVEVSEVDTCQSILNKTEERQLCKTNNQNKQDGSMHSNLGACESNIVKKDGRMKSEETRKDTCEHYRDYNDRRKERKDKSGKSRDRDIARDEDRQRRHPSRRRLSEDESSDDERYDPRKCERSSNRYSRNKSDDRERSREYLRGRSRREYDEYDHNSNRKYSDDKRRKSKNYDGKSDEKKHWKHVRDIEHERKIDFRLGRSVIKDIAKEERRVVYVGGLPYGTTQDELRKRVRRFGPVEKVSVHFREGGRDNYGFVTFFEPEDACNCIERGNSDPSEPYLDLCFGGRRQFCGGSYVDFDSKTSHIEELNEVYGNVGGDLHEEDDFDSLLRKYQEEILPMKSP